MGRFLGGIFGNTMASDTLIPQTKGVYDLNGQYYVKQEGGWINAPITASGGTKDSSTFPGHAHIFTSPGNFVVSAGSGTCQILLVGGGGGGGGAYGGGGGGGAYYPLTSGELVPGTYPVTVSEGGTAGVGGGSPYGSGAWTSNPNSGGPGGDTIFVEGPTVTYTAPGGGGGGRRSQGGQPSPGGSGGGGGDGYPGGGNTGGEGGSYGNDGGAGVPPPGSPSYPNNYAGGGGGGAGAVGNGAGANSGPTRPATASDGGIGSNAYAYTPPTYGEPGPQPGRYLAGGGGGGDYNGGYPLGPGNQGEGGIGGGGDSLSGGSSQSGLTGMGGGGGGAPDSQPTGGGSGGDGLVIVYYT